MILKGKRIQLRPLTLQERPRFFSWATRSDATPFWYSQLHGDDIPSYVVFKLEWPNHYFTDSHPEKGRCFAIELEGTIIGEVNYNEIHPVDCSTELDVLIINQKHMGQGFGSEAIRLLTHYLLTDLGVRRCRIEVITSNQRAIRAAEKAGYQATYHYTREGIDWCVMETLADPIPARPVRATKVRRRRNRTLA